MEKTIMNIEEALQVLEDAARQDRKKLQEMVRYGFSGLREFFSVFPREMTPTTIRVAENTSPEVSQRIRCYTQQKISEHIGGPVEAINRRLAELDREWDVERALEANAAGFSLAGLLLARGNRRWLLLPFLVAAFLLQHATEGWCPPLPLLRRLGIRTSREIDQERGALKLLRGDFNNVPAAEGLSRGELAEQLLCLQEK